MHQESYFISSKKVTCYFDDAFSNIEQLVTKEQAIIITDENVTACHADKFKGWQTIVIKAGEQFKQQATVEHIISELIHLKANRESFIIGAGGGVVTDIAGFVASVYMRGIRFGFVPTTILAMVDASIGGKNGIDVGVYKNLVGAIRQPEFLLYDYSFLETLPGSEWVNGFAEIIKHACIKDRDLFTLLENNSLQSFKSSREKTDALINKNVEIKCGIVSADEFENGERRLLNFGHTIGHAVENTYGLPHGHAVSIGMVAACDISENLNGLPARDKEKIISLLKNFQLPVQLQFNKDEVWRVLLMDKKASAAKMNFVLLTRIGEAVIRPIPLGQLNELFKNINLGSHN